MTVPSSPATTVALPLRQRGPQEQPEIGVAVVDHRAAPRKRQRTGRKACPAAGPEPPGSAGCGAANQRRAARPPRPAEPRSAGAPAPAAAARRHPDPVPANSTASRPVTTLAQRHRHVNRRGVPPRRARSRRQVRLLGADQQVARRIAAERRVVQPMRGVAVGAVEPPRELEQISPARQARTRRGQHPTRIRDELAQRLAGGCPQLIRTGPGITGPVPDSELFPVRPGTAGQPLHGEELRVERRYGGKVLQHPIDQPRAGPAAAPGSPARCG